MPNIAPRQGDLTQESFVDFKENQRSITRKDAKLGVLHTFQKCPEKEKYVSRACVWRASEIYKEDISGSYGVWCRVHFGR